MAGGGVVEAVVVGALSPPMWPAPSSVASSLPRSLPVVPVFPLPMLIPSGPVAAQALRPSAAEGDRYTCG